MAPRLSPLTPLMAPLKLVAADARFQLPLLLAILYYPDNLKAIVPDRLYPWITSPRFIQGLKVLLGLNITRQLNNKLSQAVLNNWKRDAKFIGSQEIVLITGGSGGIGSLMAQDFAQRGAKVIVLDLQPPKDPHSGIYFYQVDVTSSADIASAAAEIRKAHGEPTVLINNAAIGVAMTILDEPESQIRKSFDVNTVSHFLTVKEFLPAMIKKNQGHVVTVASMGAYATVAGIVDYNCTKASAVAFHEGLAAELKHRYDAPNVRTTVVTPTWVRTALIGPLTSDPTFKDVVLEPEDVASEIVKQVVSGRSGHVILPKIYNTITGLRAWPAWLQESLRNYLGDVMDIRVRYGGKHARDPRLDGGSLEDIRK